MKAACEKLRRQSIIERQQRAMAALNVTESIALEREGTRTCTLFTAPALLIRCVAETKINKSLTTSPTTMPPLSTEAYKLIYKAVAPTELFSSTRLTLMKIAFQTTKLLN